jgi:metal-responsive CopG/Arc/MetJ family transcriptional regulator
MTKEFVGVKLEAETVEDLELLVRMKLIKSKSKFVRDQVKRGLKEYAQALARAKSSKD